MPSPPLSNNFNGGSDGVAVSTGNSGGSSGDAFSSIIGSLCTYTNVQSHSGGMAMRIVDTATATQVTYIGLGTLTTSVYFRCYLYLTANPTGADVNFFRIQSTANARSATISVRPTGSVRCFNAANSQVNSGSVSVPLSGWFRVEARVLSSTTVGEIEWRLYGTDDSTLLETMSSTSQVLAADTDRILFGMESTIPTSPYTAYYDDLAVSSTGWIGPAGAFPTYMTTQSAGPIRW